MIILRQDNYSRIKKKRENQSYAWDHLYGVNDKLAKNGVVIDRDNIDENFDNFLNTALFENPNKKATKKVHRRNGYLIYPTLRYKLAGSKYQGKIPKIYGSSPKTSYKDSYRGFLRNERALNELGGYSSERFNNDGLPGPTNEDIKNEIRRLAKREDIKKWGGIGLAGAATIGGGAYLLHRYNKKKKGEKEDDNKDKENKSSRK